MAPGTTGPAASAAINALIGSKLGPWKNEGFFGSSINDFMHDSGSMIYNPYKSVHYDDWCYPAQIFNAKKERQIKCKELGCIEQMAAVGGPLEACEYEAKLDSCLYLESARYKLEGEKVNIFKAFWGSVLNNIVSLSAMLVYNVGCHEYKIPGGEIKIVGGEAKKIPLFTMFSNPVNKHVVCGVSGALFNVKELISFAANPMNALWHSNVPTEIPPEGIDFCGGVSYQ